MRGARRSLIPRTEADTEVNVRPRRRQVQEGAEVWDITKNQAYEVLAVRVTPLQVTEHEANAKAVNALFAGVSRAEFSRV